MGKEEKDKKSTPEPKWPYADALRPDASIGAILNYIAGTDGLPERQALWEFAQKKKNGEYPWDGGGPGPDPGGCGLPLGGTADQILAKINDIDCQAH